MVVTSFSEYPDSAGALDDLKFCFDKLPSDLRKKFVRCLKEIFCEKVLQPGVATHDILTAYVSAIKALRYVDPSGVILAEACAPVR